MNIQRRLLVLEQYHQPQSTYISNMVVIVDKADYKPSDYLDRQLVIVKQPTPSDLDLC